MLGALLDLTARMLHRHDRLPRLRDALAEDAITSGPVFIARGDSRTSLLISGPWLYVGGGLVALFCMASDDRVGEGMTATLVEGGR